MSEYSFSTLLDFEHGHDECFITKNLCDKVSAVESSLHVILLLHTVYAYVTLD